MSADYDKRTIAMILGLLFPGAGHILINRVRRGIRIAIAFVTLSYVSGVIISFIVSTIPTLREAPSEILIPLTALGFIPSFALWLFQILDLSKIIRQLPVAAVNQ
jgi:hypothetical protein